ncbi:MAG: BrnT family toxin, partial [Steroidobacteraceae bacterium]
MRYAWDEDKRQSNLRDHGLDFVDAQAVFAGLTFTFEDNRFAYGERRFMTLGLLNGIPVSIAHTETSAEIRVISFRKATDNETQILFSQIQDQHPPPKVD